MHDELLVAKIESQISQMSKTLACDLTVLQTSIVSLEDKFNLRFESMREHVDRSFERLEKLEGKIAKNEDRYLRSLEKKRGLALTKIGVSIGGMLILAFGGNSLYQAESPTHKAQLEHAIASLEQLAR